MEKIEKEVLKGEVEVLYSTFIVLSSTNKVPLKKCIAMNLEILRDELVKVNEERNCIFEKMLVLDENGEYAIKKGYVPPKDNPSEVPFEFLLFEEGYDENVLKKELGDFVQQKIAIEFYGEDRNKSIRVSNKNGEYEIVPLEELLYDPSNDLTPAHLILFEKFILFDSSNS